MAIDTGKIFNISIDEYCSNRPLSSKGETACSYYYHLTAVHCHKEDISEFASIVPDKAEAVVNYQHVFFGAASGGGLFNFKHHQIGVALIPNKK